MTDKTVWLISGCSTGFGRALADAVLRRGQRAMVTARSLSTIGDFAERYPGQVRLAALDVTDAEQVGAAVQMAQDQFGAVDVLVNNAGYGYLAAIEEGDEAEVRAMFETNFFGVVGLTKAVLPGMRKRRRGHVVNISSIGGLIGFPGSGYYNATKFAIEGFSESLAREAAPLGIRVTVVEPGPFRTEWAGRNLRTAKTAIADYAGTAGARRDMIRAYSGRQPGDPARAANVIIEAVEAANPPLHLLLGRPALDAIKNEMHDFTREVDEWRGRGLTTDFPAENK